MSLLPVGFGASGDDYEITDSLRLRSSASGYLSRTPATASNKKTWTWSGWVKRGNLSSYMQLFDASSAGANQTRISFTTADAIQVDDYNGSFQLRLTTSALYRDPSSWYHIVVSVDTTQSTSSDRASIYINGVKQTSFSNEIYPSQNYDTNFNSAIAHNIGRRVYNNDFFLDGYLTEINWIDGQALTADDFGEYDANGTWKAKDYTGTYGTNGFYLPMKPTTQADGFNTVLYTGQGSNAPQSIDGYGLTPDLVWIKSRVTGYGHALFDSIRGPNARLQSDTTGAETVSGTYLTSLDSDGFTLGSDYGQNAPNEPYVAWGWDAGDNQPSTGHSSITFKGTQAELKLNGFGFSPDLIWMKSRSNVGNHGIWDSVRGPTNVLKPNLTDAESSISGVISFDADGYTLGSSYNANGGTYIAWGWDAGDGDPVSNTDGSITSTLKASDATGFSIVTYTGTGSAATVGHGLSTAPDIIIVKERTSTSGWFVYTSMTGAGQYLNLHSVAAAASSTNTWNNTTPTSSVFSLLNSGATNQSSQDYVAYCFSEVSGVSKFDSYTGTGSGGHTITTGFRPGFVMIKRTDSANSWVIIDATRDSFNIADSILWADLTDAEASGGATTSVNFTDTGFELNGAGGSINASGGTYIYMAFKGSYSDYVSPLNDTGTIDSRVKANPSKGFSIVSYEGTGTAATVGHGLTSAPEIVIVKDRDRATEWPVMAQAANSGNGHLGYLRLNGTYAWGATSILWNNTAPTSSVFSIGTYDYVNFNNSKYIAYCFHSVAGYSKIDKYTGTGVAGLSVTTGFRPAFVMTKRTDSTSNWNISDSTRSPTGTANTTALRANTADTENTVGTAYVKFTDTGFEITGTSTETNANGGTYIYMAFAETADAVFNFDASGNKNNWLPNNINSNAESESTYDLMKDTPSLVDENAGNFATWNPLRKGANVAVSEGNLKALTSATVAQSVAGTIGMSSGKWYWEVINQGGNLSYTGIVDSTHDMGTYIGSSSTGSGYAYNTSGQKVGPTSGTVASYGASYTTNDVIGIALDMDAGTLTFYKNNASQGTAFSSITGTWFAAVSGNGVAGKGGIVNFGQRPFAYTPPTGFKKLNTFNLPDSTIEDGSDYFEAITRNGFGSSGGTVATNFQADLIWEKPRNAAYSHYLIDNVRGIANGTAPFLSTNGTSAEQNANWYLPPTSSTIGFNSSDWSTSTTIVDWIWKANGSGVSNNVGSIPSTVSASTTSGFSIVTFAGNGSGSATVGHGLGVAPDVVIVKRRDAVASWAVYHSSLGVNKVLELDNTTAVQTSTAYWGTVTSNHFGLSAGGSNNRASSSNVAYCFNSVEGYSAFGSYTGNGSTDGPFVYTGFRPAFVMTKRTDTISHWMMYDTSRNTFNETDDNLYANLANAENNDPGLDILSNGFKLKAAGGQVNVSSGTYIYMAFAENPFKNANAR